MFPKWTKTEPTTLFDQSLFREMSPQIRIIVIKTNCFRLIKRMNALSCGKRIAIISTKHTAEKIKLLLCQSDKKAKIQLKL